MSPTPWLIQYRSGAYRLASLGKGGTLREVASGEPTDMSALQEGLTAAGYTSQSVMLAIPSPWCLSARVSLATRRLARNRQALAYAMEEQLPLSAEELVCDFLTHETEAFGVAAATQRLLPIVNALEQAGVAVVTISPSSLLLLEQLVRARVLPADGVVLVPDIDGCDYFQLAASRPRQWRWLPCEREHVVRELATLLLTHQEEALLPVTVIQSDDGPPWDLGDLGPEIQLQQQAWDHDETLLNAAREALRGGRRPWVELRRDQLGQYDPFGLMRGSLRLLTAAVLLACVCLAACGWIRAAKCDRLITALEDQKRQLFEALFPGSRVPTGIRARLESERRRLAGAAGAGEETFELKPVTDALVPSLAALPSDLRFRLLEIRVEQDRAYWEGEVRRHGDVDLLAASLRSLGFRVEPPRTEQLDGEGVAFSLQFLTSPPAEDSPEKGAAHGN